MSIADEVRVYLKSRPYTIAALGEGIVNYSALSRRIQHELDIKNYNAVKAGVVRYAGQKNKLMEDIERRAAGILRNNRLSLLDGIAVVISSKKLALENDAEVAVGFYYVYLTRRNLAKGLDKKARESIIKIHENCSALIVHSGERIEGVPGVVAFLTSILAAHNINIIEFISCYTDTILVVERADALRCYEILSELIKSDY